MKLDKIFCVLIIIISTSYPTSYGQSFQLSYGEVVDEPVGGQTIIAKANTPFVAKITFFTALGRPMGTMPDLRLMEVVDVGSQSALKGRELSRIASDEPEVQNPSVFGLDFEFCDDLEQNMDFRLFDFDTGTCDFPIGQDTIIGEPGQDRAIETGIFELLKTDPGEYHIELKVQNALGSSTKSFTLILIEEESSIPTLSQWGLLLFILLITGLGLVTIYNVQLATVKVSNSTTMIRSPYHFPLQKVDLRKAIPHALGLLLIGIATILLIWGELLAQDIVGLIIAFPLVAYILHLITLLKKEN